MTKIASNPWIQLTKVKLSAFGALCLFKNHPSSVNGIAFRLRYKILACVLLSILLTEFVVVGFSYVTWTRDQINRLDEETLLMLKANVETTAYPSVEDVLKMGERIASFSDVKGGSIYNRLGEKIGSFGNAPSLSILTFQRENIRRYLSDDRKEMQVFYPAEATGFANSLVVRIDASGVPAVLWIHLKEKALATLAIGFVASICIVFLLSFAIIRPALALRDAVTRATDDPNHADSARLNWKRTDEFGDVARALDLLFTTVSVVYQEDLAASQEAMHRSEFAVIIYDANDNVMNANSAALKMFGEPDFKTFSRLQQSFITQIVDRAAQNISPLSILSEKNALRTVNVATKNGIKRCIMNGVIARQRNGNKLRTIVTFVDISAHSVVQNSLQNQINALVERDSLLQRRQKELRHLFHSCATFLSYQMADSQRSPADDTTIEPPLCLVDRIVSSWQQKNTKNGLIEGVTQHGVLPPAFGSEQDLTALLAQAFMYVYTTAAFETPRLAISAARVDDSFTQYTVTEEDSVAQKPRARDESLVAGGALAKAGLYKIATALGGAVDEARPRQIVFTLRSGQFTDVKALGKRSA